RRSHHTQPAQPSSDTPTNRPTQPEPCRPPWRAGPGQTDTLQTGRQNPGTTRRSSPRNPPPTPLGRGWAHGGPGLEEAPRAGNGAAPGGAPPGPLPPPPPRGRQPPPPRPPRPATPARPLLELDPQPRPRAGHRAGDPHAERCHGSVDDWPMGTV